MNDSIQSNYWLTDSTAFLQSITSDFDNAQSNVKPFFRKHELQPHHQRAVTFDKPVQDWLFLVIIALLIIVAYVRTIFTKYLSQVVSGFFSGHITNQLYRDENLLIQRTLLLLSINFTLCVSLFIYLVANYNNWTFGINESFFRYGVIVIGVSLAILLKITALKICGYLFRQKDEMSQYLFNISVLNGSLGLLLIPINAILIFGGSISFLTVYYMSLGIGVIAYVLRLVRGISIGMNYPTWSPVYLFLYLCALEIAPLLFFIKVIGLQG